MKEVMTTAVLIRSQSMQTSSVPAMGYEEKLQGVPVFRGAPVHKYKWQCSITVITSKMTISVQGLRRSEKVWTEWYIATLVPSSNYIPSPFQGSISRLVPSHHESEFNQVTSCSQETSVRPMQAAAWEALAQQGLLSWNASSWNLAAIMP